jgi:hypothetical protein
MDATQIPISIILLIIILPIGPKETERVGVRKLLRYRCGCVSIYVIRDKE